MGRPNPKRPPKRPPNRIVPLDTAEDSAFKAYIDSLADRDVGGSYKSLEVSRMSDLAKELNQIEDSYDLVEGTIIRTNYGLSCLVRKIDKKEIVYVQGD